MRIFYIGARIVGYNTLKALLENKFDVVGALILDDSKEEITVAHKNFDYLINEFNLETKKFTSLKNIDHKEWMKSLKVDIGLVIGVSNLITEELLNVPRLGFIGMHPTLLPIGRGRAPIPWTIIKGLEKTGTTLFICDKNADTGGIIVQKEYPVYYEDTCATLGKRSDDAVIELLLDSLEKYYKGELTPVQQDENKATYWEKRRPSDGFINWNDSSRNIYNWVRALTKPYPGAFTYFNEQKIMIWSVRESLDARFGKPGEIIDFVPAGILVATGNGNIVLTEVDYKNNIQFSLGDILQN